MWSVMDVLTTCCVSSKVIVEEFTHITLFDVNIDSLKNMRDVLNFVTKTWRWLKNVMIQMLFIIWNIFKREVIEKPNYYKNHFSLTEEKRELLETVLTSLFKTKEICTEKYQMSSVHQIYSLYHRQQNIMIKNILNKDHECLRRIRSHDRT